MKINTIEELSALIKTYFSNRASKIQVEEEEIMKKQIKDAIKQIEGATHKLKEMALCQLKSWERWGDTFSGQIKLVRFVCECLSDEDRVQLVKAYLQSTETISGYTLKINREHLLTMLNYLPDELKVEVLANAKPADLIRIMGEINQIATYKKEKKSTRKYYTEYYNIFKQVLVNN